MFLYLVRHGEAKSKDRDPAQGLTEQGEKDVRKVADFMGRAGVTVDRIYHSGKTRALQTAGIIAESVKSLHGVEETDGLAPLEDPAVWAERLSRASEDVMLVGHLPYMAKLITLLLCGRGGEVAEFQAGSACCLRRSDAGLWSLVWMIAPELIR